MTIDGWGHVHQAKNEEMGVVEVKYGAHFDVGEGERGYAYRDGGLDLKVGDLVVVPPTPMTPHESVATVVRIHSDYNGQLKSILRRASDAGVQNREVPLASTSIPTMVALEAVALIRDRLPPEAWHRTLDDMAVWLNVGAAHVGCTFPGIRRLLEDAKKFNA